MWRLRIIFDAVFCTVKIVAFLHGTVRTYNTSYGGLCICVCFIFHHVRVNVSAQN